VGGVLLVGNMGYTAPCEVRFEGQTARGTAVFEQKALDVRGPLRLSIPLATITEATAGDGWLRLRFDNRAAEIALGPAAVKWAKRITNPPSRLDKLGVKPGMRVLVLGTVADRFVEELRGAGATVVRRAGGASRPAAEGVDLVFYAVDRRESLERLAELASAIVPAGAIWTLRPKGQRAVTEADTMAAGKRAGLVDVKVVSFSEALTAEKFVIPVARRPTALSAKRPTGLAVKRPTGLAVKRPGATKSARPPGGRAR
jgi:hypothetical protein